MQRASLTTKHSRVSKLVFISCFLNKRCSVINWYVNHRKTSCRFVPLHPPGLDSSLISQLTIYSRTPGRGLLIAVGGLGQVDDLAVEGGGEDVPIALAVGVKDKLPAIGGPGGAMVVGQG